MVLILGVGIVGKAALKYYKNNVCFFDDNIKSLPGFEFFSSWDDISLVIASPGIWLKHDMMQEAIRRNIPITNDIGVFLHSNKPGVKIGITGTNGKSTTAALLQHVLGSKALIGGNFGISPLEFGIDADFYVLELSSYQLEILELEELHNLDIAIITNIYPSHLGRHGGIEDYISTKCKILSAKHSILGHCELFKDWEFPKAMPSILPDSELFKREEYKYCWGIVEAVLDVLNLDKVQAREVAKNYKVLPYRCEVIKTEPIAVINDSKSTNAIATYQAFKSIDGAFCWIAGGYGVSIWNNFPQNLKKVFVYTSTPELSAMLDERKVEYELCENLQQATKKALDFSVKNKLTLLFSPGYQSFGEFRNFEERGAKFNEYAGAVII